MIHTAMAELDLALARVTHTLSALIRQQTTINVCITSLQEILMATLQDLTNEIDALKQAIADDTASDQAVVDALTKTIADLQAKVATGFDTQPFIDQLEAVKKTIQPVTGETPVPTSGA